jgi:hypothetical protein
MIPNITPSPKKKSPTLKRPMSFNEEMLKILQNQNHSLKNFTNVVENHLIQKTKKLKSELNSTPINKQILSPNNNNNNNINNNNNNNNNVKKNILNTSPVKKTSENIVPKSASKTVEVINLALDSPLKFHEIFKPPKSIEASQVSLFCPVCGFRKKIFQLFFIFLRYSKYFCVEYSGFYVKFNSIISYEMLFMQSRV